jgi:hypothetical protein
MGVCDFFGDVDVSLDDVVDEFGDTEDEILFLLQISSWS